MMQRPLIAWAVLALSVTATGATQEVEQNPTVYPAYRLAHELRARSLGLQELALTAQMAAAAQGHSLLQAKLAVERARAALEGWRGPAFDMFPADSADELFRRARAELRRRNYESAAALFRTIQTDFPNSLYVSQSMYWEAFALNRVGGEMERRRALTLLEALIGAHPDLYEEASSLRVQILGALGRGGDADAAAQLTTSAGQLVRIQNAQRVAEARAEVLAVQSRVSSGQHRQESEDVRLQALNALLQMDSENAMPILQRVLQNRTGDNVDVRRRAVFLVAQKRSAEREEILLDAARNDPDPGVREQAVFHLSQVRTDAAVDALDSILHNSTDLRLQERAIFALSQHRSDRAAEILRTYVRRTNAPTELRAKALQWLGQRRDSGPFLRDLYTELADAELKEKVMFALSQSRSQENAAFMLGVAVDDSQPTDVRKQALFWVGQMRVADQRLFDMYATVTDRDLKEHLIFVYGQRRDSSAINRLIDIARDGSEPTLQGKAIFWLGHSRDPRAIAVLEEIINREQQ